MKRSVCWFTLHVLNVAAPNLSRNYCVDFQSLNTMDCDSEKEVIVKQEEDLSAVTEIKREQVRFKILCV